MPHAWKPVAIALFLIVLCIAVWVGVSPSAPPPAVSTVGAPRSCCDTKDGSWRPCEGFEPDAAQI